MLLLVVAIEDVADADGLVAELGEVAHEGGPPRWISALALLSYLGIAVGLVLIVVGLL